MLGLVSERFECAGGFHRFVGCAGTGAPRRMTAEDAAADPGPNHYAQAMEGLMMDYPLLVRHIAERAATVFGGREIVSRTQET